MTRMQARHPCFTGRSADLAVARLSSSVVLPHSPGSGPHATPVPSSRLVTCRATSAAWIIAARRSAATSAADARRAEARDTSVESCEQRRSRRASVAGAASQYLERSEIILV